MSFRKPCHMPFRKLIPPFHCHWGPSRTNRAPCALGTRAFLIQRRWVLELKIIKNRSFEISWMVSDWNVVHEIMVQNAFHFSAQIFLLNVLIFKKLFLLGMLYLFFCFNVLAILGGQSIWRRRLRKGKKTLSYDYQMVEYSFFYLRFNLFYWWNYLV